MVRVASSRRSSDPVGSVTKTSSGCATPVARRRATGATLRCLAKASQVASRAWKRRQAQFFVVTAAKILLDLVPQSALGVMLT